MSTTARILSLLYEKNGAEIDMLSLEEKFHADRQSIIEITNALAGANLIEFTGENKIKLAAQIQQRQQRIELMEKKKLYLAKFEAILDKALAELARSEDYSSFAYFTPDDVRRIHPDPEQSIFYLKGSPQLSIEMSETHDGIVITCQDDASIQFNPVAG